MNRRAMAPPEFASPVGALFADFISEKRTLGFRFETEEEQLRRFDRFLMAKGLDSCDLPENLVKEWVRKRSNESGVTQRNRFRIVRQFAEFMRHRGRDAYVPDVRLEPLVRRSFVPYVFTRGEIGRLLAAADQLPFRRNLPLRHVVIPELFRVLYGCGLRVGEAVRLTLADTDPVQGVLTVREGKFRKDRLVPLAPEHAVRLRTFLEILGPRKDTAPLFPSHTGRGYSISGVYGLYRRILAKSGILHGGRGHGPRLHDLRHAFAIHRLLDWYQQDDDLTNKLPVLATYMGHKNLSGTQRYLHLAGELRVAVGDRISERYGQIIPRRKAP